MNVRFSFMLLPLLCAACTQEPAQIVLRGDDYFGKSSAHFSSLSPASGGETVAAAPVSRIETARVETQSVEVKQVATASSTPSNMPFGKPSKPLAASEKSTAYIWPVEGTVSERFGPKGGGVVNNGIIIKASNGEPVFASSSGEVAFVGDRLKGYGNMVLITHADSRTTTYAHLKLASVKRGAKVRQGDIIGYVGSSGNAKQPQLYFAMHKGTQAVNPEHYLEHQYAAMH